MTPDEEKEHNKFMDKIREFLEHLQAKAGVNQSLPDYTPDDLMGEVNLDTGEVTYYEDATTSIPLSPAPVKADTKRVPDNLRDMVEGK